MKKNIEKEIDIISTKIQELQKKSTELTNGQRHAAINEIEKFLTPLKNDLKKLEYELYNQKSNDNSIKTQIDHITKQITELEGIKSDLKRCINHETETIQLKLNNEMIKQIKEELAPIKKDINSYQKEIFKIHTMIYDLKTEIKENEKKRQIESIKRYENIKMILTSILGMLTILGALWTFIEPLIQKLFFG